MTAHQFLDKKLPLSLSLSLSLSKFLDSDLETIFLSVSVSSSQSRFTAQRITGAVAHCQSISQYQCDVERMFLVCNFGTGPVYINRMGWITVFISVHPKRSRYGRYLNRYKITVFLYRSSHQNDKY